ncbi:MAG: cysteine peptidase family C39 domain-containing protein [Oligoflexus sp.]
MWSRVIFLLGVIGFMVSCTTTKNVQQESIKLPVAELSAVKLDVPFKKQDRNGCGPTALHLLLQFHGLVVPYEKVYQMVYTENLEATHTFDMISALRRFGLEPERIHNIEELFFTLQSGRPVLTLRHLQSLWEDRWHYDLTVGFEEQGQVILVHTGEKAFAKIALEDFVETWQASDFWGLAAMEEDTVWVNM